MANLPDIAWLGMALVSSLGFRVVNFDPIGTSATDTILLVF
jgi:hypothetical protein